MKSIPVTTMLNINFLENKDEILDAKKEKERLEAAHEEVSDDIKELADQYVDEDAYRAEMRGKINPKSEAAIKPLDKDLFQKILHIIS